jgi:aspartate kinase
MKHTVEKIGGTSMSRLGEVLEHVILGGRAEADLYHRVFVVSAFGGITNALLSNKKTGEPGVFARFASGEEGWREKLDGVRSQMCDVHHGFASLGLDLAEADAFVEERIEGIRSCLHDLMRVRSYGHLHPDNYLSACRELLSAVGEAHSAYVTTQVLQARGIRARFLDLSCWKQTEILPLDTVIERAFRDVDLASEMPIATGYVKCDVGIMTEFNRGYSEYTFSKICALTGAREGIIHKEYHLCTGDPVLMGTDKVRVIGHTNFDIADQMSDMAMEAIHARASKEMKQQDIPLRVKNAFEPGHPGTLITSDYVSPEPKVEMISGREDLVSIEVYDPDMVGRSGYDRRLLSAFEQAGISYIAKNTNANTITHCVPENPDSLDECLARIREDLPDAVITTKPVAIISVLGTHLLFPQVVAVAATALAEEGVNILGLNQASRRVSLQFIVERDQAHAGQLALHRALVES